ncbi:PHP domain-containing protein [Agromyces seonyuensis]|uniref:PHP domain-containing protein n=1 Tax=Agromyces seonyuensis TaxID=2662446 RepID=A0A6I4P148_9MICO|nr:PHP domain-containing protein [Agromyces seonyuensis]MWC00384.1 PHP domain-containing protein [Agromyces seonyuensis]
MPRSIGEADLHTHSVVSDGTQTPAEILEAARAEGLWGVALTDHDSTAGWHEAAAAAVQTGVALIPGMELSTRERGLSIHVLGYLFDPLDAGLTDETAKIREARLTRAEEIVRRIGADYPLTWEDVQAQAAVGASIGRPHIADALVSLGLVPTRSDAFDGILHPRAGYTVPLYAPDPATGIALLRAAGGVPVLAHPGTRGAEYVLTDRRVGELVDAGLLGLEIEHPENDPAQLPRLRRLAERHGLFITGSSDSHGAGKPNRLGERRTSPEVVETILATGTGSEPVFP